MGAALVDHETQRLVRAIIQYWRAGDLPAHEAILQLGSMLAVNRADVTARLDDESIDTTVED